MRCPRAGRSSRPNVPAFALVPVAPHALTHRPIAVADTATIRIGVVRGRDASAHCDGQSRFPLAEGESVTITRAPHAARFLHPEGHDYFAMLREKLHWSETPERLRGRTVPAPDVAAPRAPVASRRCFACCRSATSSLVDALDVELDPGFAVLTGETGAGKSILLDALGLLLGDRFEVRQIRPGAERAELAAAFDVTDAPASAPGSRSTRWPATRATCWCAACSTRRAARARSSTASR